MTRKDYRIIAEAIKRVRSPYISTHDNSTISLVARQIALALAKDNPRFDTDKFMEATYVDPDYPEPDYHTPNQLNA